MPGGALATFRFVSSIAKKSKLISIMNKNLFLKYKKSLKFQNDMIISNDFPKIIKSRLTEDTKNQVVKKIFTINDFDERVLNARDENRIIKNIKSYGKNFDIIMVQDFGHGLFSEKIVNVLQKFNKKLSVNVQTNSLNYGFNIIGQKLKKSKMFSLDERELQLYAGKKDINYVHELKDLKKKLGSDLGYLTMGDRFSMLIDNKGKTTRVPILNNKAKDTMGAGDIFHAMASILSVVSKNNFFNLFLSQIAGAHAVEIFGNIDFPRIENIKKTFNFYLDSVNK